MKFRICWIEYHNPLTWANCPELETERDKLLEKSSEKINFERISELDEQIKQNGITNIIEGLPTKRWRIDPNEKDNWIEVECEDTFEAKDIKEAKEFASGYDCGDSDIFTVFDNKGKIVFTEEDLK